MVELLRGAADARDDLGRRVAQDALRLDVAAAEDRGRQVADRRGVRGPARVAERVEQRALGGVEPVDDVAGGPLDALGTTTGTWLDDPFGLEA